MPTALTTLWFSLRVKASYVLFIAPPTPCPCDCEDCWDRDMDAELGPLEDGGLRFGGIF